MEVSDSAITVYADRARHLGTFDPFRREMQLGLGCAIENLVLAAHTFGIETTVQPESGRLEPSPGPKMVTAARIALRPGKPSSDPLFDAIPGRHTNRGPFRDAPIAPQQLQSLLDSVSGPDLRVAFLTDTNARHELSAIIVAATERIIGDPEMSLDSYRWIRTARREVLAHRDGVTIETSGAGPVMTIAGKMLPNLGAGRTDQLWLDLTRDVHTATAQVFGLILVPDRLNMVQAIAAGRAWQRLHLSATAHGLSAQPLNQRLEMIDRHRMVGKSDEFGPELAKLVRANGWEPTFLFRLGHARREAPRSPRRPLEQVIAG
jgi:nitroreductase